jgi:capsular polysaccharide biosynthesis protein
MGICQFNLVNRDFYPVRPVSSQDDACQFLLRLGTNQEPRNKPVFFEIEPAVSDADHEYSIRFETFAETRLGASFLVSMPGGSVLTDGFFTADSHGNILADSFRAYGMVARYGFRDRGDRALEHDALTVKSRSGQALVLGVQTNANYFHWLMEALPRLWLARHLPGLDDAVILAPPMSPWMNEMMDVSGLAAGRQIEAAAANTSWDRLLVPARGLWNIHTFTWHSLALVEELRRQARGKDTPRRLFISRAQSASRRIENEDEIVQLAAKHGFVRVFPEQMPFAEQVALFAGAEAVAGALGAGLANAAFMAPGGTLVEFAPEQRQGDAVLFANLAHHRGLKYSGVVSPLTGDQRRPFDRRDFRVAPRAAAQALDAISQP